MRIGISLSLTHPRGAGVSAPSGPTELLGAYDYRDYDTFERPSAAGYTGATGTPLAFEKDWDELRDGHYVDGVACVLLEDAVSDCVPPTPTTVDFMVNGVNLNVDGSWDEPIGSIDKAQYRFDAAGAWTDVVPTGPSFATNELHTTGPAGTHTVEIRFVSPSGIAGAGAESDDIILVGPSSNPGTANLLAWYDFDNTTPGNGDNDSKSTYHLDEGNSPSYVTTGPTYGISEGATTKRWTQGLLSDVWGSTAASWSVVFRFRGYTGIANNDIPLYCNGGRFALNWKTAGFTAEVANVTVTPGVVPAVDTWYLAVLTWDNAAGKAKLSINGADYAEASGTGGFAGGTMYFGSGTNVHIDFAGFFNKALSQDEVNWLYHDGNTRTYAEL